jgi:hypothetical protein
MRALGAISEEITQLNLEIICDSRSKIGFRDDSAQKTLGILEQGVDRIEVRFF